MTVIAPEAAPSAGLGEVGGRALLTDIRTAISATQDLLRLAWRQRIWVPLGHRSWDAFVAAELGDLRRRVPVDERRAEVGTWRAEGASVRAIASALGVSVGTVSGDRDVANFPTSASSGRLSTAPLSASTGGADLLQSSTRRARSAPSPCASSTRSRPPALAASRWSRCLGG